MEDNDIISIEALRFYSDTTDIYTHKINLKEIRGFKLHYRIERTWHVEVIYNQKLYEGGFYGIELSHQVWPSEIAKLIADKRCTILEITNIQCYKTFLEDLNKVLNWIEK